MKILLRNEIVNLRALEPTDVDLLFDWENNTELWYTGTTLKPFSRNILKQFIENEQFDIYQSKQLRLMIDALDINKTVGIIDLFDFDPFHRRAGIGIMIHNAYRNKGYALNATKLLIDYCFDFLSINQLFCDISKSNIASLNLFQKTGFKITGNKKEWIFTGKDFEDVYFLQLLKNQ